MRRLPGGRGVLVFAIAVPLACAPPHSPSPVPGPVPRADTTTVLPSNVRAALDARFARWRLAEVREDAWMWALPPATPAALWGDFDADGRLDHVLQLVFRMRETSSPEERGVFAFLDFGDSIEIVELERGGSARDALYLIPAGEETYDSTAGGWRRTPRDAIGRVRADTAAVEFQLVDDDS